MALNETNNTKLIEQIKDITKCCICTETFTDPRTLPCVHTFCLKCLEKVGSASNKKSGQNIPCPLCKKEFAIPSQGFSGIQKNSFIARHVAIGMSVSSSSSRHLCGSCLEDGDDPASKTDQVPTAAMFCTDCCMKLCGDCLKSHRKSKLSINHRLETVENQPMPGQSKSKLIHEVCTEHQGELLKLYCSDCRKVVCSFCYINSHQKHSWSNVEKAADEFRKKNHDRLRNLELKSKGLREKKKEVSQTEHKIIASMKCLELAISQRKALLIETIDKHANLLLMEVEALRQKKLRIIKKEAEDIDLQIMNEEGYSHYCQEITVKGSAGEICRDEVQLLKRAIELQEINESICRRQLESASTVVFQSSNLDEFMKEKSKNIVGKIEGLTSSSEATAIRSRNEVSLAPTDTSEDLARRALESSNQKKTNKEPTKCKDTVATSEASRVKVALTKSQRIAGIGIIENELFVVTEMCPVVEVYNTLTFVYTRWWSLSGLTHPEDMAASLNPKCLYILDAIGAGKIYQVDINGSIISSWITGSTQIRLSVASDSNVVVTYLKGEKLKEYSSILEDCIGRLIQHIVVQQGSTHAVKLKTGNFMVSRGKGIDSVFEVDANGNDTRSFKGKPGSIYERLNCPEHLAVNKNGSVFVVDRTNRRVLLLNSNLEFQSELLSWNNGLRDPRVIALDNKRCRLFVTDYDNAKNLWRIFVTDIE